MEQLCPFLGVITANLISMSPWQNVQDSINSKSIENHNPMPYPMMLNNNVAWLLYSLLVKDSFIFWGNIFGWALSLYFTISLYSIVFAGGQIYQKQRRNMLVALICG